MSNPTPTNFSCIDNRQKVYIWNAFASDYGWQVILFNNIDEFEYLMDDMPNNQGTKEMKAQLTANIDAIKECMQTVAAVRKQFLKI